MLRVCSEPGCTTRTIGSLCLDHEPPAEPRDFPRGRPYRLKDRDSHGDSTRKRFAPGVVVMEGAP
jgi:hypothetical protein